MVIPVNADLDIVFLVNENESALVIYTLRSTEESPVVLKRQDSISILFNGELIMSKVPKNVLKTVQECLSYVCYSSQPTLP